MISTEDIINQIEYMDHQIKKYKNWKDELQSEASYLNRAIERAGLTKHIEEIIKVLKEEDKDELPF